MVCSTCGYENQVGNRFCGMCGTPLPHRPLTTPGAQSTASLTRPLGENAAPVEPRASAGSPARSSLDVAHARNQRKLSETSSNGADAPSESSLSDESQRGDSLGSGNLTPPSWDATPVSQSSKASPSPFDLISEIPLHEYVQNFRYVPPNDTEEITMRGETPVLQPEAAGSNTGSGTPVETAVAPTAEVAPLPPTDDVRERLGLEVNSTSEGRVDHPRFLDFREASAPPKLATSAPPIPRPSFLDAADVLPGQAETAKELGAEGPARRAWRKWVAAVILVLGFLGVLEWQAQVRQTNRGPIEVIKAKVLNLTHSKPSESASAESALPLPPSASKPEMQVEPSSKPQTQNPPASTATSTEAKGAAPVSNTNAATTPLAGSTHTTPAPDENQSAARVSTAAPLQNSTPNGARSPTGQNAVAAISTMATSSVKSKLTGSQNPGSSAAPTADKPKPAQFAAGDDQEVIVKKIIPGTEEMAKAKNASDSAAEAAWLWKATAKGNPDAPVRLANMYIKGDGVPRSCEQAVVLLKTAATKGNALARNRLASLYSSGTCVQRNRVEAYRWLSSALIANPDNEWAQRNRDLLWQQMTPEERTLAEKYR